MKSCIQTTNLRAALGRTLMSLMAIAAATTSCSDPADRGQDLMAPKGNGQPSPTGLTPMKMVCLYMAGGQIPAATIEYTLEAIQQANALHARLTFSPDFVDNTYGENAIGWDNIKKNEKKDKDKDKDKNKGGKGGKSGHSFKDLVGSDHAQLIFADDSGTDVLDFKMDYLGEDDSAPSGYRTLGVTAKDGKMLLGSESWILRVETSLGRNLNDRGYATYIENSPATDNNYTPNPAAPDWDFRVVYDVWVDPAAFGARKFGNVRLNFVHASPSKVGENSVAVEPNTCPPNWCPSGDCPPDGAGSGGSAGSGDCNGESGCGASGCGAGCGGEGGYGGSGGQSAGGSGGEPEGGSGSGGTNNCGTSPSCESTASCPFDSICIDGCCVPDIK